MKRKTQFALNHAFTPHVVALTRLSDWRQSSLSTLQLFFLLLAPLKEIIGGALGP